MGKTRIAVIDQIVEADINQLVTRDDWLRQVVGPVFTHSSYIRNRTIDGIERIQEFVLNIDGRAAASEWKSVIARHRRLTTALRPLIAFVNKSKLDDIISFVRNLQMFFSVENSDLTKSRDSHYRAINRSLTEALPKFDPNNYLEVTQIVAAELLHIRLKWAMLHNEFIVLQLGHNELMGSELMGSE